METTQGHKGSGAWIVYWNDFEGAITVFDNELDALRYSKYYDQPVRYVPFGSMLDRNGVVLDREHD